MKTFAEDSTKGQYEHPITVRHQGKVIVLALYDSEDEKDKDKGAIYYRVLALDPSQSSDDEGWTHRQKINFPDQIRPAGMSLVTVGQDGFDQADNQRPKQTTAHPFQAVSDGRHIYIFRQSPENTLYVDRFVFDTGQNELKSTWEARFQRSRKRDIPFGRKDTLGPRDMEKEPFIEPTLELHNVNKLHDGRFCVLIVPTGNPGQSRWQIFAYNSETEMMDSYSIRRSEDGLFDSGDLKKSSFRLENNLHRPCTINSGPAALLYMRQEEVIDDYGRQQRLKRETRIMLAVATVNEGRHPLAVLDFGVAQDGSLAAIGKDTATLPVLREQNDGTPMPIISSDPNGVSGPTVMGGILDFALSKHTPSLLDSADGLVHLYFHFAHPTGAIVTNFYVLQFDTLTTRASHTLALSSEPGSPSVLRFTARLTGARMNGYQIEIGARNDSDTCRVTLRKQGGEVSETWTDVPRRLPAFIAVLNGQASLDPQEAGVLAGERVWYDYETRVTRLGLPSSTEPVYGSLLFGVSAQNLPADSGAVMVPLTVADAEQVQEDQPGEDCRWIREPPNYALRLNGKDDLVSIKNSQALVTAGDVTVEGWVNLESTDQTGIATLYDHIWLEETDTHGINFGVRRKSDGAIDSIFAARQMSSNSLNTIKVPKTDFPTGTWAWAHLAATFQASYALHLDGTSYVDCDNDLSLNMATAMTFEAWVTRTRTGTAEVVASKWSDEEQAGWILHIDSDGKPVFKTGSDRWVKGTDALEGGKAYHLAAVFDAESREEDVIVLKKPIEDTEEPSLVEIKHSDKLNVDNDEDFTVELWFKPTALPTNGLRQDVDDGGIFEKTFFYSIRYTKEDKVKVYWINMETEVIESESGIIINKDYHHLALVKKKRELKLYIDGKLEGSATVDTAKDSKGNILLGAAWVSPQRYFYGEMNDIRIWKTARSQEEILDNLFERNISATDDLVGYWPVGSADSRGTIADASGNENAGTLGNAKVESRDRGVYVQRLYVDGELKGEERLTNEKDEIDTEAMLETTRQPLTFGLGAARYESFEGNIDEVRLWQTGRNVGQIDYYRQNPLKIPTARGLVSYWPCDETPGAKSVWDAKSENDGQLINPDPKQIPAMLVPSGRNARWAIYVDGVLIPEEDYEAVNDPNLKKASQAITSVAIIGLGLAGAIDEVRVWNTVRTEEQIRDNRYRRLGGNEDGLLGYWRFDVYEGRQIRDQTGNGADGELVSGAASPTYREGAPISNEGPEVRNNYYGDTPRPQNKYIEGTPAVAEYGDVQWDSDGNLIGVMKRCYIFAGKGLGGIEQISMVTGFAVGNLELNFIGQVQTAPTLIGYIEGAPPVPSENLTMNDPELDDYGGSSSIELTEANETIQIYSTSRDKGDDISQDTKYGLQLANSADAEIPLLGTSTSVFALSSDIGEHTSVEISSGVLDEATVSTGATQTLTKSLKLSGHWEQPRDYDNNGTPRNLNPRLGQRYIPDNVGYALVKSGTADLFGLRLKQTGSLVAYHIQPSPDIPEDWNIIIFPLNPKYVKNGTLDGMVGLVADPDYPNALSGERGSYFKPLEAYALKDRIEREAKRIAGYYERFDPGTQVSMKMIEDYLEESDKTSILDKELGYDWKSGQAKRGMVNTYVWTARGGFYAEEEQFSSARQESLGSLYSSQRLETENFGDYTTFAATYWGVGGFYEQDILKGTHLNITVMKSREDQSAFGMHVEVEGEPFIDEWNEAEGRYLPIPGKVNAYRFMTFYLAPDLNSFDAFFDKVVDPTWLARQGKYQGIYDPDAQALKQAKNRTNEVWRVLHRVTYVSRVPEQFGSPPAEVIAPNVREPDNIAANRDLIQAVGRLAATLKAEDTENKSKLVILGEAIDQFLKTGQGLEHIISWWKNVDVKNEGKKPELRKDLLTYLKDYFEIYPWPQAPVVRVGPTPTTTAVAEPLAVTARVVSTGLADPEREVTTTWAKQKGPGTVTFSAPAQLNSTATFSQAGTYALQITVDNGMLSAVDEVTVVVEDKAVVQPPSRPEPIPRPNLPIPENMGTIVLLIRATDTHLWNIVEWQDGPGNWHVVEGWQGTLDKVSNGVGWKQWNVESDNFGKGPFRWRVFQKKGGRLLATSDPFYLPKAKGDVVFVEV